MTDSNKSTKEVTMLNILKNDVSNIIWRLTGRPKVVLNGRGENKNLIISDESINVFNLNDIKTIRYENKDEYHHVCVVNKNDELIGSAIYNTEKKAKYIIRKSMSVMRSRSRRIFRYTTALTLIVLAYLFLTVDENQSANLTVNQVEEQVNANAIASQLTNSLPGISLPNNNAEYGLPEAPFSD